MGEVYRAHDGRLKRDVAIKLLPAAFAADPARRVRLENEARVLAALNHPHIGAVYGLEEGDGLLGVVLELIDGDTLAERIARRGRLALDDALMLAGQLVDALEAAHERGIVHRDLKPANLKVSSSGSLKVLDFGLARTEPADYQLTATATAAGVVSGTVPYMSPEQARGEAVDRRTDIWAFGCVLFEMLAGTPAFSGRSSADIVAAVLNGTPDWTQLPAEVPPRIHRLLRRCLEKEPRRRLRDIGDARFELNAVDDDAPAAAAPRSRRARWPAWLAAAAGGALIGATSTWLARVGGRASALEPLAFEIAPPAGSSWGPQPVDPLPIVSPDGRRIAFAGRTPAGRRLWFREAGSLAPQELAATQDVTVPYWSSDGRKIAYCVGGRIKKVDIGGRPPEDITVSCAGDGDWRAGGDIVFTGNDGLYRVSERGGSAERLTTVSAPREAMHLYPRWLPDGRQVLFLVKSADEQVRGLYVVAATGGTKRRILPDESMGIPVSDANGRLHVVFVRGSTLVEQQVDASLAPAGDTVVLAERVLLGLTVRRGAYAASSSTLVYRTDATFAPTRLQWFDRSGLPGQTVDTGGAFIGGLALSPDETTVAFGRYDRNTNAFALWLADRTRGTTRLLSAPSFSLEPESWSADGRSIATASNQSGIYRPVLISPAGQLSPIDGPVTSGFRAGDWSADGKQLVGVDGNVIWAVPIDGSSPRQQLAVGRYPKLSPDGRWLAYSSTDTGNDEVYVQRFPDGSAKTRVSTAGGIDPKWRGDGRELFYLDAAGDVTAIAIRTAPTLELGAPVRLFRAQLRPDVDSNYLATRDGQHFLLNLPSSVPAPLAAVVNWLGRRDAAR